MSRILLVEDNDPMREILQALLEQMGHEVIAAGNGREALALQLEQPVDLMLTDIFMPEMEGLETIQQIRRRYPQVKIIAMSGGAARGGVKFDYLEMARKFGALAVLSKPFSNDELAVALKQVGLDSPPNPPA